MVNLANDSTWHSMYQCLEEETSLFIATSGHFDKWERGGAVEAQHRPATSNSLERLERRARINDRHTKLVVWKD